MKIRIKIRVGLSDRTYSFLDPVLFSNGKLKPLYAVVDGKPEHHPAGTYFLRYAKSGKRAWERRQRRSVVLTAKQKRKKSLEAKAVGVQIIEDAPVTGKDPVDRSIS